MQPNSAKLYSSGHLLQIARDNVRASQADTLPSIVAIVFSALSLEAIVNELLEIVREPMHTLSRHELATAAALAEAAGLYTRQATIEAKILGLVSSLSGTKVTSGGQPYQDCGLLVTVRNLIVHSRPETRIEDEDGIWPAPKVVKRLVERRVLAAPDVVAVGATIGDLQNYAVARWSFETMVATVQAIIESFPRTVRANENLDAFYGRENLDL